VFYGAALILAVSFFFGVVAMSVPIRTASRVLIVLLAAVIFSTWVGFFAVSASDYHDADGWIDCGDSCSNLQMATGSVFGWGLVALFLLLVAVGFAKIIRSFRRTGS